MTQTDSIWKIPLFDLSFDDAEKKAVCRVLDRKWLTMGPENNEFEEKFREFNNANYCLSVNSCTAALHMAVLSCEVGPGDEVIVPSLTFVATANAVRYCGATPVFADITGITTPLIDPISIQKNISPKTKAIIVVHYAGYACDMDAICEIARKNNLKLIEDCAHAPGARWRGKALGTFGDFGCFSFFSNKNLSMGEGGALLTNSEEHYKKCKYLRSHGMSTLTLDRHKGHAFTYDVVAAGFNYRLDEIRAAIGIIQLEKLPAMNQRRNTLVEIYKHQLHQLPVQTCFPETTGIESVGHIMPIVLPQEINRETLMGHMKSNGIQTSIHYPSIHYFSDFKNYRFNSLIKTEEFSSCELTLPLFPALTEKDISIVVDTLAGGINAQTVP